MKITLTVIALFVALFTLTQGGYASENAHVGTCATIANQIHGDARNGDGWHKNGTDQILLRSVGCNPTDNTQLRGECNNVAFHYAKSLLGTGANLASEDGFLFGETVVFATQRHGCNQLPNGAYAVG